MGWTTLSSLSEVRPGKSLVKLVLAGPSSFHTPSDSALSFGGNLIKGLLCRSSSSKLSSPLQAGRQNVCLDVWLGGVLVYS
jgi:hypothetical protein